MMKQHFSLVVVVVVVVVNIVALFGRIGPECFSRMKSEPGQTNENLLPESNFADEGVLQGKGR